MDAKRLQRLRGELGRYLDAVLPDLGRQGRRSWAELYVRGLLLDRLATGAKERTDKALTLAASVIPWPQ